MAYTRTTWANGSGGATPISAANLNNIEVELVALDLLIATAAPATTLPGSPVNGQIARLTDSTTAPTYVWTFRYNTTISGGNKWQFIAGLPVVVEIATAESRANAASYAALSTAGPSFAIPVAGDYLVEVGAQTSVAGAITDVYMSYDIGGTGAVDADAPSATLHAANYRAALYKRRIKALTAVTLTAKYKSNGSTATFSERVLSVTPRALAG